MSFGAYTHDRAMHALRAAGVRDGTIWLSETQSRLLALLVDRKGEIVTHNDIARATGIADARSRAYAIARLRNVLVLTGATITSVSQRGYRLDGWK